MSVLKGEGRVPILFATTTIAAGTQNHNAYLARPDLVGEHPTIVVVPSAWGITSSTKDLCRRLSRWGFAAVAADLYRGREPERSATPADARAAFGAVRRGRALADLEDLLQFVSNPAGFWSSAEDGVGILGVGDGGPLAIEMAARWPKTAALALAYGDLGEGAAERLAAVTAPVLGLYGKADEIVDSETIAAARATAPHAEWVLYEGVGHDYLDDYLDAYDHTAATDALERLVGFFEKHLPESPA